jgi:hypothetical protein
LGSPPPSSKPGEPEEPDWSEDQGEPEVLSQEELERLFLADFEDRAVTAPDFLPPLDALGRESVRDRREDRKLRTAYAHRWFILVAVQLGVMNVLLILAGSGCLTYSDWLFHAYLIGTLGECFGIVLVITRNLFPRRDSGPADPRAN